MVYKVLKFIVKIITVITAIIFIIYQRLSLQLSTTEVMIMALLCLIAFSAVLEDLDSDKKWGRIKNDLSHEISSISQCRIRIFSSSSDWVTAMKELTSVGVHSQDTASLDSTTRSKAQKNHNDIWAYINECCADENTIFRHIVRIRISNFENLLDRILSGSANKNTFFAYYNLDPKFSFPTFGIIDKKYVATRSPYQEGETPQYMIIESAEMVTYYSRYYDNLWVNAAKIDSVSILEHFYSLFKSSYDNDKQKRIECKIQKIKERGIIDDI